MDHDIPSPRRCLDPGGRAIQPDIAGFGVTLERTPHMAAGNGSAGRLRVKSGGVYDRDIARLGHGLHIAGFDNENGSAALCSDGAGNTAGADLTGRRVKFGISSDITDLEGSALAAYFCVAAHISGFNKAALSDDGGLAFDLAGGDVTSGGAENGISIDIANVDIAGSRNKIQIEVSGRHDPPEDGSANLCGFRHIACEFDIFTAVLLDLNEAVVDLDINGSLAAAGIDLHISDRSSYKENRPVGNRTFCQKGGSRECVDKKKRAANNADYTHHHAGIVVVDERVNQCLFDRFIGRFLSQHLDGLESRSRIIRIAKSAEQQAADRIVLHLSLEAQRLGNFAGQFDLSGHRISTHDLKIGDGAIPRNDGDLILT